MKFTLIVLSLIFSFSVKAQITLTNADMPTVGWGEKVAKDTLPLPAVNYGSAGANKVYDFSNLVVTHYDSIQFKALTPTQQQNFPNATIAITTDNVNFVFERGTNTVLDAEGLQGYLGGVTYVTLSPVEDLLHFTTQYGNTYSGTWGFRKAVDANLVGAGAFYDSIIVTYTDTYYDTIDGWGKVITPIGAYKGLREARKDVTHTKIEGKGFLGTSTISNNNATTLEFTYLAKETKGAVVSFDYDSVGNMRAAKYSMISPAAPVAHFTYLSGGAGVVNFTDATDGYATSYSWTFGDGGTANTANPSHTYAANGTYYVCETVTNAGGSNTYCDSVHVTNIPQANRPPVATNDVASTAQGTGVTLHPLTNDTDPDGNTLCVSSVYGNAHFTVANCSTVVYSPGSSFSGNDTAYYVVCDNGSPSLCDTGMIVVTVIPAINHAPVAGDDFATVLQNHSTIINAAANDVDQDGNTLCISALYGSNFFAPINCDSISFTPDAGFTGNDTCWYIICDNGSPAECDTAMIVVTVLPAGGGNHAPVANNDAAGTTQGGATTINPLTNDADPDGDTICVSAVYGNAHFTVANCSTIVYTPGSSFTGNDTAYYIVCDNGNPSLCDTAMILVTVSACPLPTLSILQPDCMPFCAFSEMVVASVANADSLAWHVMGPAFNPVDTIISNKDTLYIGNQGPDFQTGPDVYFCCGGDIIICLSAWNSCGVNTLCDTILIYAEGVINETQLTGISLYPNPANNVLTIDMRNNRDDATHNYNAVEIYNAVGERMMAVERKDQNRIINLPVGNLAQGMYLATMVDANGVRRTLGRFVKE